MTTSESNSKVLEQGNDSTAPIASSASAKCFPAASLHERALGHSACHAGGRGFVRVPSADKSSPWTADLALLPQGGEITVARVLLAMLRAPCGSTRSALVGKNRLSERGEMVAFL